MVDRHGVLIYVGKAKRLRTRLLSYFRAPGRDKASRILNHTRGIVWEFCPSEFAALLRELELIRRWQPRFNVFGQPSRRRRTYVCVGRRPAPYVFLARRPARGTLVAHGPVPAGWHARQAVRWLNDYFRLRDCPQSQPMVFADQGELFPVVRAAGCLRHEIGTCLGPCTGGIAADSYGQQIRGARAFLSGLDAGPITLLEREMEAAAAELAFERAAVLRDKLEALRWLWEKLDQLRQAWAKYSFVYPVAAMDGKVVWYLIRQGQVVRSVYEPRDDASARVAAGAVAAVFRDRHLLMAARAGEEAETVLLVAGWFRRYPNEAGQTLAPAAALASCGAADLSLDVPNMHAGGETVDGS
jgi:excinuclease ABC subunit C